MSTATVVSQDYVTYLLPGVMVPEEYVRKVAARDPQAAITAAPAGAYAFQFHTRTEATADGVPMSSQPTGKSGMFYIDAERMTSGDLEAMGPRYSTLLANMRGNGWPAVVRCLHGNFQPLFDGDQIVGTRR